MTDLLSFLFGFALNFIVAFVIVRFIYYPQTRNKSYVFTFLAFNTIIFFVLRFMASIEIGIGVGFGLFAIFSILRYRTDPIPIREMTYLFLISALPLMNSASIDNSLWPQLLLANLLVFLLLLALEKGWGFVYESSKQIVYEKIELVIPSQRAALVADLETRTGLRIKHFQVGKIDYLHDTAYLKVYYDEQASNGNSNNFDSELSALDDD